MITKKTTTALYDESGVRISEEEEETKLYTLEELEKLHPESYQKALEKISEINDTNFDASQITEDLAENVLGEAGYQVEITYRESTRKNISGEIRTYRYNDYKLNWDEQYGVGWTGPVDLERVLERHREELPAYAYFRLKGLIRMELFEASVRQQSGYAAEYFTVAELDILRHSFLDRYLDSPEYSSELQAEREAKLEDLKTRLGEIFDKDVDAIRSSCWTTVRNEINYQESEEFLKSEAEANEWMFDENGYLVRT